MKQTTGAQGAWAGKEETTAHLTQKELDCPGARITQHLRARHDRREAGSTEAHPGDTEKYTNNQYESLVEISKALIDNYKDLNKDNIVGHSDISPDRKEDPGKYFEWSYYLERL